MKKTTEKKVTTEDSDPASLLYKNKTKSLDLDREVDSYAAWSFGITAGQILLIGLWFLFPLFLIVSIIGVILGFISLVRLSENNKLKGKAYAIIGIIIGIIQILIYGMIILFFILGISLFQLVNF